MVAVYRYKDKEQGFTLIELIVALGIMSILATTAIQLTSQIKNTYYKLITRQVFNELQSSWEAGWTSHPDRTGLITILGFAYFCIFSTPGAVTDPLGQIFAPGYVVHPGTVANILYIPSADRSHSMAHIDLNMSVIHCLHDPGTSFMRVSIRSDRYGEEYYGYYPNDPSTVPYCNPATRFDGCFLAFDAEYRDFMVTNHGADYGCNATASNC